MVPYLLEKGAFHFPYIETNTLALHKVHHCYRLTCNPVFNRTLLFIREDYFVSIVDKTTNYHKGRFLFCGGLDSVLWGHGDYELDDLWLRWLSYR